MALVFQYGSNISLGRINDTKRLNGSAKFISVVQTVKKYNFDFTVWSKQNQCAAADIIEGDETKIIGALYDIPDRRVFRNQSKLGSKCLDQIEGEGSNYQRIKIKVENLKSQRINEEIFTYVVINEKRNYSLKTSIEYVSYIISGLENINISSDYIDYVKRKAIHNNPALESELGSYQ